MMKIVGWDTWAFIETALGYSRSDEVGALWDETDVIVTSRDIIGETYTLLLGRTRNRQHTGQWLEAVTQSKVRIIDPSFESLWGHMVAHPESGPLSWQDMSLAFVADQAGARTIATEDKAFQRLAFSTPFARG